MDMDEYAGGRAEEMRERDESGLARGLERLGHRDHGGRGCPGRDVLKVCASLTTSALFFPFLVWGGFVFLPFDAPLLDGAPLRMLYALRCSVFAAAPVVLGWLAVGATRLRRGASSPLLEQTEGSDLDVHREYTRESAGLFLMYFLQLAVTAVYLSQERLKLVPLLAIVFALGRLIYWPAAASGSSVRAFGLGLSLLPGLAMTAANLAFIFTVEAQASVWSPPQSSRAAAPAARQRFWG